MYSRNRPVKMESVLLKLVLVLILVWSGVEAENCDESVRKQMQEDFNTCLNKFMQKHHEAMGKSQTKSEIQSVTCQMLKDSVECGNLWSRCHTPQEIRSQKDMHIAARIQQYQDRPNDINVNQCPVIQEYLQSGRANQKRSEEERCTSNQVFTVQGQFQSCSHNISGDVWNQIKDKEDAKRMALRKDNPDIDYEENILNTKTDIQPLICMALHEIKMECSYFFEECFNKADSDQMIEQNRKQLVQYFGSMFEGFNENSCPKVEPKPWSSSTSSSSSSSTSSSPSSTSSSTTATAFPASPSTASPTSTSDSFITSREPTFSPSSPPSPTLSSTSLPPAITIEDDYYGYKYDNSYGYEEDDDEYKVRLDYEGETNDIAGPIRLSQTSTTEAPRLSRDGSKADPNSNYQAGERISANTATTLNFLSSGVLLIVLFSTFWNSMVSVLL